MKSENGPSCITKAGIRGQAAIPASGTGACVNTAQWQGRQNRARQLPTSPAVSFSTALHPTGILAPFQLEGGTADVPRQERDKRVPFET